MWTVRTVFGTICAFLLLVAFAVAMSHVAEDNFRSKCTRAGGHVVQVGSGLTTYECRRADGSTIKI